MDVHLFSDLHSLFPFLLHEFLVGIMEKTSGIKEKSYPNEMDEVSTKLESMRRGKILSAWTKGDPHAFAEDIDERVRRALMYYNVWKWQKNQAYEVAGISRSKFDAALAAGGAGIVTMGPKVWLTPEIIEDIYKEITRASMDYNSYRNSHEGEKSIRTLILTTIQSKQINTLAVLPTFSADTWNTYMDIIGARVRKGDVKAKARQRTKELRTPLSFCSVLRSLWIDAHLSARCFYQSDDISLLIHPSMDQKDKLITTAEAIEWLDAQSRSVATTNEEAYKQRIMGIHITLHYDGPLCVVLKVYDKKFPYKEKPKIIELDDGWYACLAHPSISQFTLGCYVSALCVKVEGDKRREFLILSDIAALDSGEGLDLSQPSAVALQSILQGDKEIKIAKAPSDDAVEMEDDLPSSNSSSLPSSSSSSSSSSYKTPYAKGVERGDAEQEEDVFSRKSDGHTTSASSLVSSRPSTSSSSSSSFSSSSSSASEYFARHTQDSSNLNDHDNDGDGDGDDNEGMLKMGPGGFGMDEDEEEEGTSFVPCSNYGCLNGAQTVCNDHRLPICGPCAHESCTHVEPPVPPSAAAAASASATKTSSSSDDNDDMAWPGSSSEMSGRLRLA